MHFGLHVFPTPLEKHWIGKMCKEVNNKEYYLNFVFFPIGGSASRQRYRRTSDSERPASRHFEDPKFAWLDSDDSITNDEDIQRLRAKLHIERR